MATRTLAFVASLALMLNTSVGLADERISSTEQQKTAVRIGGVGLGTTLEKFLELLPTSVAGSAPSAVPMRNDHFVVINNGTNQVPVAYFRFLDNAVSSIEIHYSFASAMEIRGDSSLLSKFESRFGKCTDVVKENVADGGTLYRWKSEKTFVCLHILDDGSAQLFTTAADSPALYPPKTPKTSILGID